MFTWGEDFNMIFDTTPDADGCFQELKINSLSELLSMVSENDLWDIFSGQKPRYRTFSMV